MNVSTLNQELGNIDIYLLDLILKGHYKTGQKILDAGCGEGRNLHWFLNNGFEVYGIDANPSAIQMLKIICDSLNRTDAREGFFVGPLDDSPFPPQAFDHIICSAVLHFAKDENHFMQMIAELNRVLKPGGKVFIRMASLSGLENRAEELGNGRYLLPDGSVRFLMTETLLGKTIQFTNWQFIEPLKNVLVAGQRSMNMMFMQKPA